MYYRTSANRPQTGPADLLLLVEAVKWPVGASLAATDISIYTGEGCHLGALQL